MHSQFHQVALQAKAESNAGSSDEEGSDEGQNLGDQGSEESESGESDVDPEVEAKSSNHGGDSDSEATLALPGNGMEYQEDVPTSPSSESMDNLTEADSDAGVVSVESTVWKQRATQVRDHRHVHCFDAVL